MAELKLSPEQFGLLGSSFFFLFAISAAGVAQGLGKKPEDTSTTTRSSISPRAGLSLSGPRICVGAIFH
jgi:hypothetical protein